MPNMNENNLHDTVKTLADRLKWARDQKGWTQPHLALVAEVSTSTVGMVESGARMNKGSLPQLATALGVRHRWLLHGELPVVEPIPESYKVFLEDEAHQVVGLTATPKGTARVTVQVPAIPEQALFTRQLSNLGAMLNAVPPERRDEAVAAAVQALLSFLPPAPTL